ncbi:MAG: ABATE domain-containing protein [Rhodospirillales bacterium]
MLISNYRSDLALAFVNTRYWRGSGTPTEELATLPAVSDWLHKNGALDDAWHRELKDGKLSEDEIEMLLDEIIILRETMYRVFAALATPKKPAQEDIKELSRALRDAVPRDDLRWTESGFTWDVFIPNPDALSMLAPVLWSAVDLLVGDPAKRLRLCNNDKCLYLFLDNSRTSARRWCDMKACGNRAKAHRHYLKTKAA